MKAELGQCWAVRKSFPRWLELENRDGWVQLKIFTHSFWLELWKYFSSDYYLFFIFHIIIIIIHFHILSVVLFCVFFCCCFVLFSGKTVYRKGKSCEFLCKWVHLLVPSRNVQMTMLNTVHFTLVLYKYFRCEVRVQKQHYMTSVFSHHSYLSKGTGTHRPQSDKSAWFRPSFTSY